jgi:hypothetical protein
VKTRLLVMGVVCVGLALYYASFEMSGPGEKKQEEKLLALDRADLSAIEIQGGALIRLVKKGAEWWIEGDVNFPADQEEVGRLVDHLLALRVKATMNGPRGEFDLDAPAMVIILGTSRGKIRLSLGTDSPTGAYCYASLEGRSGILLLPAGTKTLFRKSLFSLTDKHLLHINPWDVSTVRIVKDGDTLEIVRDRGGDWHLPGGDGRKLSREKVNGFFRNICSVKAIAFPENQDAPETPDVAVELTSSRGVMNMKMWRDGQKGYALSDYQRGKAEIDPSFVQAVPVSPDDLLDKSIVPMEGRPVRLIAIQGRGERQFYKRGGQWYDGKSRSDEGKILDRIVSALSTIQYEDEYLSLPHDAGAGLRMTVYLDAGAAPFDITLYSQYYVAVGKRVFRINEGDMNTLKDSLRLLLGELE